MSGPYRVPGVLDFRAHEILGTALKSVRFNLINTETKLGTAYGKSHKITAKATRALLHVEQLRSLLLNQLRWEMPELEPNETMPIYYGDATRLNVPEHLETSETSGTSRTLATLPTPLAVRDEMGKHGWSHAEDLIAEVLKAIQRLMETEKSVNDYPG